MSPRQVQAAPAWVPERLEYRFSVRTGMGDDQRVWRAPLHEGGAIDWYSFDSDAAARMELAAEPADARTTTRRLTMLASPLQYAGMPSDRLWQFENGAVNFGRFEIQRHDLARLCLVEFAMIYGDDWFVVPLDVDAGSFTTVGEVAYTTTFGDRLVVPPADDRGRAGRFRLFEHNHAGSAESGRGLFIPPSARRTQEGAALEDVLFIRDESANMAWAIEATVATPLGDPRQRREEPQPPPDPVSLLAGAELQYRLATVVPRHWIPLVPVRTNGRGGFILRKGTMTDRDEAVGEVLRPTPLHLQEEEVPREGVRVRRVPALARSRDGTYRRWITRRISVGRGEGASGLAFDGAYR